MKITIQERIPRARIVEEAEATIITAHNIFKQNPHRRVLRVEGWYGEVFKVRKHYIRTDINAAAQKAIDRGSGWPIPKHVVV